MTLGALPDRVDEFSPEIFTQLIQSVYPDVVVENFRVIKSMQYGEGMVSTAARALIELDYLPGTAADLPKQLILKLAYDLEDLPSPLYANEVYFYQRLRKEMAIETPKTLGAHYDPGSRHFGLLLEDLTQRQARFPNVLTEVSVQEVDQVLVQLARLHASYWQSPRFATDLSGLQTHVTGELADFMNTLVPHAIQYEIDHEPFKKELVAKLASSGDELLAGMLAVQKHQAGLPQTLLHGDSHIGNTYLLPEGAGLLDWQLMVRGYCMHDVNYLITTALPIDQRRLHEKELLQRYLTQLQRWGVSNPPSFNQSWDEYRRTLIWGVYIGWLTTPVVNYGWQINTLNLLRLTTAFDDHSTAALVAEVQ